ncbi:MAG: aminotransferase class V-fold PLP-dependent enzyme, partial [Firmicutes bacterium]|nr:aminotransferase class V-fold PLP-dependent enzyme [Bacillota bacterium]
NSEYYFNPSGNNIFSGAVAKDILAARSRLADMLGFSADEVIFTSGATEANNMALRGSFKRRNSAVITTEGEHPSVYNTVQSLQNAGAKTIFIGLNPDGTVRTDELLAAVGADTSLVSVIHTSNETGAVNDINALAARVKAKNPRTLFHSDGVQAFCKGGSVPSRHVDLYSVSAHKIGGLKGAGALCARKSVHINKILCGGGQESGLRPGTENVPGIMAFKAACEAYPARYDAAAARKLKNRFLEIVGGAGDMIFNSDAKCQPNIVSISFGGVKAETLSNLLAADGIVIGLGSACSSKTSGNRALSSMGVADRYVEGNVRVSFPHDLTVDELEFTAEKMVHYAGVLRKR